MSPTAPGERDYADVLATCLSEPKERIAASVAEGEDWILSIVADYVQNSTAAWEVIEYLMNRQQGLVFATEDGTVKIEGGDRDDFLISIIARAVEHELGPGEMLTPSEWLLRLFPDHELYAVRARACGQYPNHRISRTAFFDLLERCALTEAA